MKKKVDLSNTYISHSKFSSRKNKQMSNAKSFFLSSQTIDNVSKIIDRKIIINKKILSQIKNNIISPNKANEKKEIINPNFINNYSLNKKYFKKSQSYRQPTLMNKKQNLTAKMYEKIIQRLFNYMKIILPREKYYDISNRYLKEVSKELHFTSKKNSSQNDLTITNLIKSTTANSLNDSNTNSFSNLKLNSNNNIHISKRKKEHSSLYSLNKLKILNYKTMSHSKSKSPSKSSKSNSKEKKHMNKVGKNSAKKLINCRIFNRINKEILNIEALKPNKNSLNNKKKFLNKSTNKKYINNMNYKKNNNNLSVDINNITFFEKKDDIKDNDSLSTEKRNKIKNSEQLIKIKSTLDEELKKMFNFSYESFLNKESESNSKKSFPK